MGGPLRDGRTDHDPSDGLHDPPPVEPTRRLTAITAESAGTRRQVVEHAGRVEGIDQPRGDSMSDHIDPPDDQSRWMRIGDMELPELQAFARSAARAIIARYTHVKAKYWSDSDDIGIQFLNRTLGQHASGTDISFPKAYLRKALLNWARAENRRLEKEATTPPPPDPDDTEGPLPIGPRFARWCSGLDRVACTKRPAGKLVDYRAILLLVARFRILVEAAQQNVPMDEILEAMSRELPWSRDSGAWPLGDAVEVSALAVWEAWAALAIARNMPPDADARAKEVERLSTAANARLIVVTRDQLYQWTRRATDWATRHPQVHFSELLLDLFPRFPGRNRHKRGR